MPRPYDTLPRWAQYINNVQELYRLYRSGILHEELPPLAEFIDHSLRTAHRSALVGFIAFKRLTNYFYKTPSLQEEYSKTSRHHYHDGPGHNWNNAGIYNPTSSSASAEDPPASLKRPRPIEPLQAPTSMPDIANSITQYNQGSLVFRNRRESRRHRNKRKRLYRLDHRLNNLHTAAGNFLRDVTITLGTVADQQSLLMLSPLNSFYGANGTDDDLWDICNVFNSPSATASNWPAGSIYDNKYYVEYAHGTCEITNLSSTAPCYVDVYKYVFKQDYPDTNTTTLCTGNPPKWTTGTNVATTTIGVTPFDFSLFTSFCKVLSKVTYLINPSQNMEIHWNAKGYMLDTDLFNAVDATEQVGLAGHTTGLCIISCGVAGAATKADVTSLKIYSKRKYRVRPLLTSVNGLIGTTQSF